MENKNISLIIKDTQITQIADNPDVIIVAGYANKFLTENGGVLIDHSGESVLPSSYNLDTFKINPIVLFNHHSDKPVGKAVNIGLKPEGLYVEIEVHKKMNEEVFYGVNNGILKTFSIGFKYLDGKYVDNVFYYTDIELMEVSIVSVPDNNESTFAVLTESPCANGGTCLLASSPTNKKSLEYKNEIHKDIIGTEWKSIDKEEMKTILKELNNKELIEETYLIIKDDSFKFPHHILSKNGLYLSTDGLNSAFSALKSLQDDSVYSYKEQIGAYNHLLKHYNELIEIKNIEEIPEEFKKYGDILQDKLKSTINSNENVNKEEEDSNSDQNPADGEENETVNFNLLDKVEELKGSPEGLDTLLEVYIKVEEILNNALTSE